MTSDSITTRTIIDLITQGGMTETEIVFDTLIVIKTTPHYHLMDISAVSVDEGEKLWVKTGRNSWMKIDDHLLYRDYILGSLYQRLKIVLTEKAT
jgi:hypothetical protein